MCQTSRSRAAIWLAAQTCLCSLWWLAMPCHAQRPTRGQVESAMHQAVDFFRLQVSAHGGYVYQYSADLSKQEGEGIAGPDTAWIQPPGTPSVGLAYLEAYQLCRDPLLLEAARHTATGLLRGQLRSGGWDNKIEFAPDKRQRYAYRVDEPRDGKQFNVTTFDDDKSQSVIRFLMRLDQELKFKDEAIHEAVQYALAGVLRSQYPNGAWPQRYDSAPDPEQFPIRKAEFPSDWPREFPGNKYAGYYTLNDNTISDLIVTLLDAFEIYQERRYLQAAVDAGDFFVLAQLPQPQPGWAQQYDRDMHPAWARKFEPPAISGGESQGVMRTLMMLYRRTAGEVENAERFLKPIPAALAYYRSSLLADGRLARFYELGTNRPLYFTKDYQLTYSSDDMPTHYGFIVSSKLDRIESEYQRLQKTPLAEPNANSQRSIPSPSAGLDRRVTEVIAALDKRGAWVESGGLSYHGDEDRTDRVIRSKTFADRIEVLASWLAAEERK